jgi:hypothetical protein
VTEDSEKVDQDRPIKHLRVNAVGDLDLESHAFAAHTIEGAWRCRNIRAVSMLK